MHVQDVPDLGLVPREKDIVIPCLVMSNSNINSLHQFIQISLNPGFIAGRQEGDIFQIRDCLHEFAAHLSNHLVELTQRSVGLVLLIVDPRMLLIRKQKAKRVGKWLNKDVIDIPLSSSNKSFL